MTEDQGKQDRVVAEADKLIILRGQSMRNPEGLTGEFGLREHGAFLVKFLFKMSTWKRNNFLLCQKGVAYLV